MRSEWTTIVETFFTELEVERNALEGALVWLGRSAVQPASGLADDLTTILENAGARVSTGASGCGGLITGQEADRLSESHAVMMLAATPGVAAEAMDFCKGDHGGKPVLPRMHVLMPTEHSDGYISYRFRQLGANLQMYGEVDVESGKLAVRSLSAAIATYRTQKRMENAVTEPRPVIGIVTALQLEFEAVRRAFPGAVLTKKRDEAIGLRNYLHVAVPADGGGVHEVVFVKAGMGNNKATAAAKQLLNDYKSVRDVIMVGIAAGVPDLSNAKRDVRLGDVVISDEKGVIKYDMKKTTSSGDVRNHEPRPPSSDWLSAAQALASEKDTRSSVLADISAQCGEGNIVRPRKDELLDEADPTKRMPAKRPRDADRTKGQPRFFFGPIGSADTVMKSAKARDEIADATGVMAVEMEGSGVAEVTWQGTRGYLIVRGICDYANDAKNKEWQPYAATAAAAFVRRMIESMPLMTPAD